MNHLMSKFCWARSLICFVFWAVITFLLTSACAGTPSPTPQPPSSPTALPVTSIPTSAPTITPTPYIKLAPPPQLFSLCWVAYSPTNFDPDQEIYPLEESIRQDLQVLQAAGFTGLVTYGANGTLGSAVPRLAQELGFRGLIMGIWDPTSETEREQAIAAANYAVTVGFVVGNEGLGDPYDLATLQSAMDELRRATGKPVATTEEIGDYSDPTLLALGDWVFPNAHPFYAGLIDPNEAVAWTEQVFADLRQRTDLAVMFKEVGLPTGGDPRGRLNEAVQAEYYRLLRDTDVQFVYFESFDQPWKEEPSVEPFWGLFKADRTPKKAVQYVCAAAPATPTPSLTPTATFEPAATSSATPISLPTSTATPTRAPTPTVGPEGVFNVYTDADAPDNHFTPSGYMGDTGDITVNVVWTDNPYSGTSAIKITYAAEGRGPNACPFAPPCKWAGVYWQTPPDNWGTVPEAGFDLRGFRKLTFWARSDTEVRIEFKVGGIITGPYPDSIQPARSSGILTLSSEWQRFEINLADANLSYVIGGFAWVANWNNNGIRTGNPKTLIFYLDDIRFER